MPHFVYILYSRALDKFYIGRSSDPEGRLVRHNLSHRGFTSKGQPWEVVYTEFFDLKSDATAREKQLKGWKNRDRLMSLIGRK